MEPGYHHYPRLIKSVPLASCSFFLFLAKSVLFPSLSNKGTFVIRKSDKIYCPQVDLHVRSSLQDELDDPFFPFSKGMGRTSHNTGRHNRESHLRKIMLKLNQSCIHPCYPGLRQRTMEPSTASKSGSKTDKPFKRLKAAEFQKTLTRKKRRNATKLQQDL